MTTFLTTVLTRMLGTKFNSTEFNVSTSAVGVGYTGFHSIVSVGKAVASPSPSAKALYCISAGLNAVSCASSIVCLMSGYSCIGGIPTVVGVLGWSSSRAATFFNCAADCMDPTGSGKIAETCINKCVDFALKGK